MARGLARSRRPIEEAVEDVSGVVELGSEEGGGDFAPGGGGNRVLGRVGECGDYVPCDPRDLKQPLLQLPLRSRRRQNALRLTRILGSLDLHIRSLDMYSRIDASRHRERFNCLHRTVEKAYPGVI